MCGLLILELHHIFAAIYFDFLSLIKHVCLADSNFVSYKRTRRYKTIKFLSFQNVLYSCCFSKNLLSFSQFSKDENCKMPFDFISCVGKMIAGRHKVQGTYYLDIPNVKTAEHVDSEAP